MTDKIKLQGTNILIYVVETTGLHSGIGFFVLEVEEKKKTYKVVKAYEYAGDGLVKETSTHIVLQFYRKGDKEVFANFEDARAAAIERMERMILRCQSEIKINSEKLNLWRR